VLKEGGRLGVVLPESVFDTTENKYIRLFLFKYFNIKVVVSLPQITFEPYTSTKTSLLFAQKKTKAEVEKWNEYWDKYGKEWGLLATRINDYNLYFVEDKELNKKWAKDVVKDIEENNTDNILKNIKRFLKDYITAEDNELEIKALLIKYSDEIVKLSKYEKETNAFGFYNAWWVFGEVAKELDCSMFMAEAENVGYKRTKRGINPMPNDLFDLEYAPTKLDCKNVIAQYDADIKHFEDKKADTEIEKAALEIKNGIKENASAKKKVDRLIEDIESYTQKISSLKTEKIEVKSILTAYYEND
jgi:type I restriction enzyme M protein